MSLLFHFLFSSSSKVLTTELPTQRGCHSVFIDKYIHGHGIWSHGVLRANSGSTNWIPHSSSEKWGY